MTFRGRTYPGAVQKYLGGVAADETRVKRMQALGVGS